jgi:hypothetical protein
MPSKQVTDREKSAKLAAAAVEAQAQTIGRVLGETFRSFLTSGEVFPDMAFFVVLLGRFLRASGNVLVERDDAYQAELSDDAGPRFERDEMVERLQRRLVQVRDAINGVYGPVAARRLGFADRTPRDPEAVVRLARHVVGAIPEVRLDKPLFPGASIDLTAMVQQLTADADDLQRHLEEVAREVREAQVAKASRDQAMEKHDANFSQVANLMMALLRLAGQPELADRFRPSQRTPGQMESDETPPTDTGGATPPTSSAAPATGAAAPVTGGAAAPQAATAQAVSR